jgi:hypothetical protein
MLRLPLSSATFPARLGRFRRSLGSSPLAPGPLLPPSLLSSLPEAAALIVPHPLMMTKPSSVGQRPSSRSPSLVLPVLKKLSLSWVFRCQQVKGSGPPDGQGLEESYFE